MLKIGAPVMLLVNLGDRLCNGMTGKIHALHEDASSVIFTHLTDPVVIKPHMFSW